MHVEYGNKALLLLLLLRDPGLNLVPPCQTLGKLFHSILLQFVQLYE